MSLPERTKVNWHQQAQEYLLSGNYTQAINLYEAAIRAEAEVKSHYWNLGLILLLQGQEVEAQTTWLLGMAEANSDEQVERWTFELIQILLVEAERREKLEDYSLAWVIRQHLREINPTHINNLLHLLNLSIKLEIYTGDELTSFGIIELLGTESQIEVDSQLLLKVFQSVLNYASLHPQCLELTEACLPHLLNHKALVITILLQTSVEIAFIHLKPNLAARFAELGLELEPENVDVLIRLALLYQDSGEAWKGIEIAKKYYTLCQEVHDQVYANHLILRGLMHTGGGYSEEVASTLLRHELLLQSLTELRPSHLSQQTTIHLFSTVFYFPYLRDDPTGNNYLRQQVAQLCQENIKNYAGEKVQQYRQKYLDTCRTKKNHKVLKVGYLSHCLRVHSVGWLARWLFQYHNPEKFQIYAYLINAKGRNDRIQNWYVNQVHKAHQFPVGYPGFTDQIIEDELDILVDLDSITLDATCEAMAAKTAPIQVTWLGWDASEIPTIDYYIADPYVLPENAQNYYSETIWRLPQTYIAVDGFEVAVPTLRREDLKIPSGGIIYLSSQTGYKYNPKTARLQMQIIKEVPNSYFLIKGVKNQELVEAFFTQLAEEEGVNPDRLIFLSGVPTSAIHRANLAIADVILDTFPYNGATTTLETLWMEVPMVTRVGQQFASRNSYTMMINAGITEGIAWTDEEYVEWGIRLGTDEQLRQQVAWKLRKSKQTAPLWNGKQFTREMEKAYQQMWQNYLDSRG